MSLNRPFALSIGLAAGVVAAVGCYTAAAGAGAAAHQTSRGQRVPAVEVVAPQPSVSFAPCVPPAELEDGACVTHKVVTLVLPPTSGAPSATVGGSTSSGHSEHRTSGATRSTGASASEDEGSDAADTEDATEPEHEDSNQQEDQDHEDVTEPADEPGGDTGDDSGESHTG